MKGGLLALNPFQVASIRILSAGLVLLPWAVKYFRQIPRDKLVLVFMAGCLGSLIPAYLFCMAEMEVDSALAGTLNSLTPIFVIITGVLFFSSKPSANKITGIVIAFVGTILLMLSKGSLSFKSNFSYGLLIVVATLLYGINVNIVHKYLGNIGSLKIAAVALSLCAVPALVVLICTGYFTLSFHDTHILMSTLYSAVLGIFGTAMATVLFYMLVKNSDAVYSSMVTYCIPIVADVWGIIYGEKVGFLQLLCLLFILSGVYLSNKKGREESSKSAQAT